MEPRKVLIRQQFLKSINEQEGSSTIETTRCDWSRDKNAGGSIYVNGQKVFQDESDATTEEIEQIVKEHFTTTHPLLKKYVKNKANQNGFLHLSATRNRILYLSNNQYIIICDPLLDRYDFVETADGSITVIESHTLCGYRDTTSRNIDPIQTRRPIASIIITSKISELNDTVQHKLINDEIRIFNHEHGRILFKDFTAEDGDLTWEEPRTEKKIHAIYHHNLKMALRDKFDEECNHLQKTIDSIRVTNPPLAQAAQHLLNETKTAVASRAVKATEVPKLTRLIKGTSAFIKNPQAENATQYYADYIKPVSGIKGNWAKAILGASLAVIGIAIVAASITLAVSSFGVATPASAVGAALGVAITEHALICLGAGIVGLGVGGFSTYQSCLFAKNALQGKPAVTAKQVIKSMG